MSECAPCNAEAVRLSSPVSEFRSAVTAWSALQKGSTPPAMWKPLERRVRHISRYLRWQIAAAALVLAVAVPICRNAGQRQRAAEAFRADSRLWEEVNVQVSRPVPSPLEPLMNLVEWEPQAGSK